GSLDERLGHLVAEVTGNGPVGGVDDRRDDDGDDELVAVVEQRDRDDLGEGQLAREGHQQYEERVEELGAEGGAGGAEPEVAAARSPPEPVEQRNVHELADEVGRQATDDDAARGSEHVGEGGTRDGGKGAGGTGGPGRERGDAKQTHRL